MSDVDTTPAPADVTSPDAPPDPQGEKPDESDLTRLREALRKEREQARANAQKAKQYDELAESQKTEQQKLTERAEAAEKALPELQAENARLRVAIEKNLPLDLADRLRGNTPEELAKDADSLLAQLGKPNPGSADQGVRPAATEGGSMNDLIRSRMRP